GERAIVAPEEVDSLFDAASKAAPSGAVSEAPASREELLSGLDRSLQTGRFDDAATTLERLKPAADDDEQVALAVAESKSALAHAYGGDETGALADLRRGVEMARTLGDERLMAVTQGSIAIVHQRGGRKREAREAYEAALAAAEAAKDAWTIATTRLNLAVL